MPLRTRQSLGLGGDGDEMELLHDLERTFALRFDHAELENILTIGELENAVWRHLADCTGDKCISAMAFYKLRRLLKERASARRISVNDAIAPLAGSPRRFAALLKRETGIRLDYRHKTLGQVRAGLQFGWLAAMGLQCFGLGSLALIALVSAIVGLALMRCDEGRFIDGQTVGDVAKLLATQSYGHFARRGGRISRPEVVARARALMAEFQGFDPTELGPDTVLMGKRYSVFSRR
jgi:hypothetical protein